MTPKHIAAYKMLKQGCKLPVISGVMDVSIGFLENLQENLGHEPQITSIINEGKKNSEEIANQLKVPALLVKAIKNKK